MGIDLVSIDDFKAYKTTTDNDKYDPALSIMIAGASQTCKTYCRRSFVDYWDTDKVEYHDGTSFSEIFLEEFPIRIITSLEYSLDGSTYTALTEGTDFFVNGNLDTLITPDGTKFVTNAAYPTALSLKVTYKAGYSKIPEDLKLGVLDLVEYYRKEKSTPKKSLDNTTTENTGFRAGAVPKLPPYIARVFEMYKAF